MRFISWSCVSFNPRSRGGSDLQRRGLTVYRMGFNPRSRGGSDHLSPHTESRLNVSIRAPAGGATARIGMSVKFAWFQSALPRGERLDADRCFDLARVSIRAPAGGATHWFTPLSCFDRFQSALPRGERL